MKLIVQFYVVNDYIEFIVQGYEMYVYKDIGDISFLIFFDYSV